MTIAVDDVCTDADLANEIGDADSLAGIIPRAWDNSAEIARQSTLDEILAHLSRRTPPILETSISDETELTRACIYGSLSRLYRMAMSSSEDVFATKEKRFASMFRGELNSLKPTLTSLESAISNSLTVSRR